MNRNDGVNKCMNEWIPHKFITQLNNLHFYYEQMNICTNKRMNECMNGWMLVTHEWHTHEPATPHMPYKSWGN